MQNTLSGMLWLRNIFGKDSCKNTLDFCLGSNGNVSCRGIVFRCILIVFFMASRALRVEHSIVPNALHSLFGLIGIGQFF